MSPHLIAGQDQSWAFAGSALGDIMRVARDGPRPGSDADATLVRAVCGLVATEVMLRRIDLIEGDNARGR